MLSPVLSVSNPTFGQLEIVNPVKPNNQKDLPVLVKKGAVSGLTSGSSAEGSCACGRGRLRRGAGCFASREKHLSAASVDGIVPVHFQGVDLQGVIDVLMKGGDHCWAKNHLLLR